jgi:hypothetical protein
VGLDDSHPRGRIWGRHSGPRAAAGWDREVLAIELQGLIDLDFDIELTGYSDKCDSLDCNGCPLFLR